MNSKIATAVVVLGVLGLTGCGNSAGRMANSGLCADFNATNTNAANGAPATTATVDAATPVDDCVRRWAYSLAGSTDNADVVADAVVVACGSTVSRWNQAALAQPSNGAGVSLTTVQPSNPLAEHSNFAHGRAIFYVVQARAGQCAPPHVVNGLPAGASPL